jgi:hypothetical protein
MMVELKRKNKQSSIICSLSPWLSMADVQDLQSKIRFQNDKSDRCSCKQR